MMEKPKVFDCFTFWMELDLLEIRLNILDEYVDKFVLVESHETFSGQPKPLYYEENKERFAKWNDKIIHIVVPNIEVTDGNFFKRHYLCYEAIELALMNEGQTEDIAMCSDLDEIWDSNILEECDGYIHSLTQFNYSYWLNYRSNEEWQGTLMSKIENIFVGFNKRYRTEKPNKLANGGWHFSNMGGVEQIIKKIEAYDHSNEVIPMLSQFEGYGIQYRIEHGQDFLGRPTNYQGVPYEFHIEEDKNLPTYLVENKDTWPLMFK